MIVQNNGNEIIELQIWTHIHSQDKAWIFVFLCILAENSITVITLTFNKSHSPRVFIKNFSNYTSFFIILFFGHWYKWLFWFFITAYTDLKYQKQIYNIHLGKTLHKYAENRILTKSFRFEVGKRDIRKFVFFDLRSGYIAQNKK